MSASVLYLLLYLVLALGVSFLCSLRSRSLARSLQLRHIALTLHTAIATGPWMCMEISEYCENPLCVRPMNLRSTSR